MLDSAETCPPHPGYMGGICIRCGASKSQSTDEDAGVALRYIHHGLEISQTEADRLRKGTADRVIAAKRLLLILDLDHTLLNSTRFVEVTPEIEEKLEKELESQPEMAPLLYKFPHMHMWTKIRPGTRRFLELTQTGFDLHVYTMGDREYAAEMAKILDPEGNIFHGRIISSGDSTQRHVKDLDVILGHDVDALIVDDTEGVWPRHKDNLVQIPRYVYFPADALRFGGEHISLFLEGTDEDPESGALNDILKVLTDVRQRFFESALRDVRIHLAELKKSILGPEVVILFSRVFPVGIPDPESHPLWQLALKLGARSVTTMTDEVTHVVGLDVTEKTKWAQKHGKHVVDPAWLYASATLWKRADESKYPLGRGGLEKTTQEDVAQAMAAAGGGPISI